MNNRIFRLLPFLLFIGSSFSAESSGNIRVTEQSWQIRYILFVTGQALFKGKVHAGIKLNANATMNGDRSEYRIAAPLLDPRSIPGAKGLVSVLVRFDITGDITSGVNPLSNWSAVRDPFDKLVIQRKSSSSASYLLAEWNQGIPGDVAFSPAVCAGWDNERYSNDWDPSSYMGSFGCREWTAQLYDSERPYIDVTSYGTPGPFIGDFVGWSRFTDPQKPVIGLQRGRWLCLLECPSGEQPGLIKDIMAWTQKHGFPMPQRPPKQPLYPNSDYLDDIHELDD